jgi:putative ABC transport system permease protein
MAIAFEVLVLAAVVLAMLSALAMQRGGLAVLRALGAPPRYVFGVVWVQALAVIGAGIVLATVLAALLMHAVSDYASARSGLHVTATLGAPELALLAVPLVLGSLVTALAALLLLRRPVGSQLRGV